MPDHPFAHLMESAEKRIDMARDGVLDLDFEWFACDGTGKIAVFASGTVLSYPLPVLEDRAGYLAIARAIYLRPRLSKVIYLPNAGAENAWFVYAARGLYDFDVPPYEMQRSPSLYAKDIVPERPALVSELPPEAAAALERLCMKGVDFASADLIDISNYWPCI